MAAPVSPAAIRLDNVTKRFEAFEAVRANMPEGIQDFDYPFAAAVAVGDDASGIDRLVAWSGRDPHWSA